MARDLPCMLHTGDHCSSYPALTDSSLSLGFLRVHPPPPSRVYFLYLALEKDIHRFQTMEG